MTVTQIVPVATAARGARRAPASSSRSLVATPLSVPRAVASIQARRASVVAQASQGASRGLELSRRDALVAALAIPAVFAAPQLSLADEGYESFYGAAYPPATYGTKGDTTKEEAKYSYDYPPGWEKQTITKIEKGTRFVDSRLKGPLRSKQQSYVVTLDRAGEDSKSFALKDPEQTLNSIVGTDFDLQDIIQIADSVTNDKRVTESGQTFYEYEVQSMVKNILISITVDKGRLFGLFVESTPEAFANEEATLRHMIASFQTFA